MYEGRLLQGGGLFSSCTYLFYLVFAPKIIISAFKPPILLGLLRDYYIAIAKPCGASHWPESNYKGPD